MKDKIVLSVTNKLARIIKPDIETYEILKYGVELFYINIYKTMILIILAVILGIWQEVLVFMAAYCLLRSFAMGIHLQSEWGCIFMGLVYYIGSAYFSRYIVIQSFCFYPLLFIMFIFYLLYAPSGTKKRPIGEIERKRLKTASLICLFLLYLVAILIGSGKIRTLITLAALCETINISPVTFRIFKQASETLVSKTLVSEMLERKV